jgi:hypothetical protein
MDAAIPVDAKNAPTGIWKTAQNAVSHERPHPSSWCMRKKNETRTPRQLTCPPIRIRSSLGTKRAETAKARKGVGKKATSAKTGARKPKRRAA